MLAGKVSRAIWPTCALSLPTQAPHNEIISTQGGPGPLGHQLETCRLPHQMWGHSGQEVTRPQARLLPEQEGPADPLPWRLWSWEEAQCLGSASVSSRRPPSTLQVRGAGLWGKSWSDCHAGPTPKYQQRPKARLCLLNLPASNTGHLFTFQVLGCWPRSAPAPLLPGP